MDYDEARYKDGQEYFLGYPCNMAYDYSALYSSFQYHFNNVGNPYEESTYRVNTKNQEQQVLKFFQELWGFDPDNVWGYITANGTEGNLQAFYVARLMYPTGVVYMTNNTHYSIAKIAKLVGLPLCIVQSQDNGEMNYRDFETKLLENKDKPAIINANLGTTMLGATDNTREIYRILCKHDKHTEYYMHADGALMGFVLPFIEKDLFFRRCIHSISVSGHKFLGIPFPCGIFMMEKRFLDSIKTHIEIIGTSDCTIAGSRNGHSALFFDYIIKQKGHAGFEQDIMTCIDNTEYLIAELNKANVKSWRNQNSLTVVMDRPHYDIISKWQLASVATKSHVVVLPHVTKNKIHQFVNEIRSKRFTRSASSQAVSKAARRPSIASIAFC